MAKSKILNVADEVRKFHRTVEKLKKQYKAAR